jgi:spermidine synthase
MGYGFPNLMREGSRVVARLGRSVGGVYFANIVGSTLGTVVIGFYVIHYRGTENSMRALVVLSALVPLAIFLRQLAASGSAAATTYFARNPGWLYASVVLMAINTMVFPVRPAILRAIHLADFHEKVEFIGQEDASGVVALRKQHQIVAFDEERRALGAWRLHIDGARHGGFASDDLEEMRWIEVDVALAAHPAPRRGLCIGLGDGRMCYSAVSTPGVQELVVVELNSVLRDVLSKIPPGKALLDSPKLRDVVGDGRHWLLDNPNERFDFIMMFPLHAAHANSGALFSLEALTLLKQHLNPGGIVYLCSTDAYSTAKTMATVFPYVVRLGTAHYICGLEPIRLDVARTGMAYDGLSSLLSADQDTILANTADAPLNRDFHPNSEYYVTYPFAWVLRTLNQDKRIFSEPDPKRLAGIIPKGQADPPGP